MPLEEQNESTEVVDSQQPVEQETSVVDGSSTEPIVEEYVPNRKFKVLDEEKEFDEFIAPALNKDTEPKIRELYEKAYGIDHVKTRLQQEREAREQYEAAYGDVTGKVQQIIKYRDSDLGRFFREVGLDKQKVAAWLIQQAESEEKLQDLPEPMRKVYNEYEALKLQNETLQQQMERLSAEGFGSAVQARTTELHSVLSRPEIQPLVQAFDARLGRPGAFFDQVVRHGQAEYQASGGKVDLNAEEAVNQVLSLLNLQTQPPAGGTPNGSVTPGTVKTAAKPTVLPNVGSSGGSVKAARPKSLDDLRAIANKMAS